MLGLVRRHGAERVDDACQRAVIAEAVSVGLIDRMLTRDNQPEASVRPLGCGVAGLCAISPISRSGGCRHEHVSPH